MQVQLVKRSAVPGGAGQTQHDIEVQTVDGFQGREKDVILVTCVRSNNEGRLGFLTDHRRVNVAFTRARRGLIVIGNPATLCNDPVWGRWVAWIQSAGLECSIADLLA
jgi:ATP-dependent RNA/DNA helicase IGHMBP2